MHAESGADNDYTIGAGPKRIISSAHLSVPSEVVYITSFDDTVVAAVEKVMPSVVNVSDVKLDFVDKSTS